jgi:hypothetical protein
LKRELAELLLPDAGSMVSARRANINAIYDYIAESSVAAANSQRNLILNANRADQKVSGLRARQSYTATR